jgi:hypothetical protein
MAKAIHSPAWHAGQAEHFKRIFSSIMTVAAAATLYFFLLVAAGIVGVARKRMGTFSWRGVAVSVLGLSSLMLGGFIDLWGAFLLIGGPDGQFLSKNTLLVGGACTLLALLIIFLALRLLSMPGAWVIPPEISGS